MKILFIGTQNPKAQGDYGELSIIHGMRSVLGSDFVEYPKKKILYGNFLDSPKDQLHGKGFTYCDEILNDTDYDRSNIKINDFDAVIHGSYHIYGEKYEVDHPNQFWTDMHDLYGNAPRKILYNGEHIIGTQFLKNCFKRELVEDIESVWPLGFGIPENKIQLYSFSKKRMYQSTAPSDACFYENSAYKFNDVEAYYKDMNESWFGLTCKKGGFDSLRHYELMAAKTLVLFKDYDKKPFLCPPIDFPTISYSTKEELENIMNRLVVNNQATEEYFELLNSQTNWLIANGTARARAEYMLEIIKKNLK